jgi:hypothetical protein
MKVLPKRSLAVRGDVEAFEDKLSKELMFPSDLFYACLKSSNIQTV